MKEAGSWRTMDSWCAGLLVLIAPFAWATDYTCVDPNSPCYPKCGGEVTISGATLFESFFRAPASTNDYIDADCDGQSTQTGYIDQLAVSYPASQYWWLVQYRGVGSGNGLAEFVRSRLEPGWEPPCPPLPDVGLINRFDWKATGNCLDPNLMFEGVHLAVMDVPTTWFVRIDGTPDWTRRPTEPGYGNNPVNAWNANQSNKLKTLTHPTDPNTYGSLNLNLSNPDNRTVYDTPVAWVPIAFVANRGAHVGGGTGNVKASELQVLYLTGRMPNGENLVAATRDAGSGTRNGAMNSICVDPSWGIGDNLNLKSDEHATLTDLLGPDYQATNMGGSSRMEAAVQNGRLAVGYTGLVGSSRAIADANAGKYEILSVQFDVRGGVNYARPSLYNCIHNSLVAYPPNVPANPDAWQVGGNETFASLGDPTDVGFPMAESPAKDYLNNIRLSIAGFVNAPPDPNNYGSPGEYLATQFSLTAAVDAMPNPTNPCSFELNPDLNLTLRTWTLNNNHGMDNVPGYPTPAGSKAPERRISPTTPWPDQDPNNPQPQCDCPYPPNGYYSDGTNGSYWRNRQGGANVANGANLVTVAPRNLVSGDFNGDGQRDLNDIPAMMLAAYDPNAYAAWDKNQGNSSANNPVIVEIIGDFNGDGNFDCRDVRYFADGLAIDPSSGKLNRGLAFKMIDDAWFSLTGTDDNYFNTTIYDANNNPRPWQRGAAAADVAGNTPWPGARPHGYDCRVDCQDAAYVDANFGVFPADIKVDLSCDMTGDLVVDCCDAVYLHHLMGAACSGLTHPCFCVGDLNGDGWINFDDINPFVQALGDFGGWQAAYPCVSELNADINGDGTLNFDDINPFVALLGSGATCP